MIENEKKDDLKKYRFFIKLTVLQLMTLLALLGLTLTVVLKYVFAP